MLDIENLNVNELQDLIQEAEALVVSKQGKQLVDAYKQFETIAEECDSTINEIMNAGQKLVSERNVRYMNPENSAETWTGRGRKPIWLVSALEDGHQLSEFEV